MVWENIFSSVIMLEFLEILYFSLWIVGTSFFTWWLVCFALQIFKYWLGGSDRPQKPKFEGKLLLLLVVGVSFFNSLLSFIGSNDFPSIKDDLSIARAESFSEADMCRATNSVLFNRPVSIIKVKPSYGKEYILSYVRPADGILWDYKCRVEGDQVLWGSPSGRWRNHASDEKVKVDVSRGKLEVQVTYPDGSSQARSFSETQF